MCFILLKIRHRNNAELVVGSLSLINGCKAVSAA